MPLILAIQPDRRQAAQLTGVIRRVGAELLLSDTTAHALDAIGNRVPDLVLVPALLSPQDDAALAGALRVIAAAAHVRILTTPVLGNTTKRKSPGGVLAKWRRGGAETAAPDGCDPAVFGEQISDYLKEAAAERAEREEAPFHPLTEYDGPADREAAFDPLAEFDAPAGNMSEPTEQSSEHLQAAAPSLKAPMYEGLAPAIEAVVAIDPALAERIEVDAAPGAPVPDEVLVVEPVSVKRSTILGLFYETKTPAVKAAGTVAANSEDVIDLSDQLLDTSSDAALEALFHDERGEAPAVASAPQASAIEGPHASKSELWMPRRSWPRLEGVQAEAAPEVLEPEEPAVPARREPLPVVRPPARVPVVVAAKPKAQPPAQSPKEALVVARPQAVPPARPPAPAPIVVAAKPKVPPAPVAPKEAAVVARPQPVPAVRPPAIPAPVVAAATPKAGGASGLRRTASETDPAPKEAAVVVRPVPAVRAPAPAPTVVAAKPRAGVGFGRTASEPDLPKGAAVVARPQPVPVVRPAAPVPVVAAKPKPAVVSGFTRTPSAPGPKEAVVVAQPQPAPAVRPPAPAPIVAAAKRQEWLELIDSLRLDVERLRSGRDQAAPPVVSAKPKEGRAPTPAAPSGKKPTKRAKKPKPIQDEWGFFDPEQCGFAALLSKLEEITEEGEEPDFDPKD